MVRARWLGVIVMVSALMWAAWPSSPSSIVTPSIDSIVPALKQNNDSQTSLGELRETPLDQTAFARPIWPAPAFTPEPHAEIGSAPPPPPSPPLRLQLLAITREGDANNARFVALLYDPDTDRLLSIAEGDQAAGRSADQILATSVRLRDLATGAIDVVALVAAGGSGGGP